MAAKIPAKGQTSVTITRTNTLLVLIFLALIQLMSSWSMYMAYANLAS